MPGPVSLLETEECLNGSTLASGLKLMCSSCGHDMSSPSRCPKCNSNAVEWVRGRMVRVVGGTMVPLEGLRHGNMGKRDVRKASEGDPGPARVFRFRLAGKFTRTSQTSEDWKDEGRL